MAYTFHVPYSDEAIILSEFVDGIDAQEMGQWWLDMAANVQAQQAPVVYLVIEVARSTVTFDTIFGMYRDGAVQHALATLEGTELVSMLVGNTAMARLAATMTQQQNIANMPIFRTLEDAHEFIAVDLAKRASAA
ncbi:MAG: hypothetical protein SGI73_17355 [Chloroflexota bacterium]|nr:hypothetical protein [Chloroflexota bacterium]